MNKHSNYGPDHAAQLIRAAENAGVFKVGIASDKRGRGSAINVDCVGHCMARGLAIVQVRETSFRPGRYSRTHKDYYLVGRVENGDVFAHPVESPLNTRAGRAGGSDCVDLVLSRIWQCPVDELRDIERQGDIALIPVRALPGNAESVTGPVVLRESHVLTGDIWRAGDTYYTRRGARLRHTKREHAPIRARGGYYRVQEGIRAAVWGFSVPTVD